LRITSIDSRILRYDSSDILGTADSPRPDMSPRWHQTSLDTIHTDEGIDGYTMQNGNLEDGSTMARVLHDLYAPHLVGSDPMEGEALWNRLRRLNRHAYNLSDGVAGSIDVALWDIRGKAANLPVASLLGMARHRIGTYATARTIDPSPDQVFAEAQQRKGEGYQAFKIQFWDGLKRDIPRFRAAREAVGPAYPLMQDAAGMYSYTEAVTAGRVLEELDYAWFEEPIPDRQTFQLKRLCDELKVPVLSGETLRVSELAEGMRRGDFDIARGDVHMKGGITGLHKAAGMADLLGYDLEVHAVIEPILDIANLHVACAMNNCRWSEAFNPSYQRGLKGNPLAIDSDGFRHVPTGPGLGVELDWDWIDQVTTEVIRTPAS
jgi:L-alanine-DL-glutamate epimerase-like enolase superfamily enzyme